MPSRNKPASPQQKERLRTAELMKLAFRNARSMVEIKEIPDENGKPLRLYFTPLTQGDFDRVNVGAPENETPYRRNARLVIAKAETEDGTSAFVDSDIHTLMYHVRAEIMDRIILTLMAGEAVTPQKAKEVLQDPPSPGSDSSSA